MWPTRKREFFANFFTCYRVTKEGVVVDIQRREKLILDQLELQQTVKSEPIISRINMANYILIDGSDDGTTLKQDDEIYDTKLLILQRSFKSTGVKIQPTLVGGELLEDQGLPKHFKRVVKDKLCNGADLEASTIADVEIFGELRQVDDLTFFSSCSLDPTELIFLSRDQLFNEAIKREAEHLARETHLQPSSSAIEALIRDDIASSSANSHQQVSLDKFSIPCVQTGLVLYDTRTFNRIARYTRDITSLLGDIQYKTEVIPLHEYLFERPLESASLIDYSNVLKVFFLLKYYAGKSMKELAKEETKELYTVMADILVTITKNRFDSIMDNTVLASPPAFIAHLLSASRVPEDMLAILRNTYYIDLYKMAEKVGYTRSEAYKHFGMDSAETLRRLTHEIDSLWDKEKPALLMAIEKFLDKKHRESCERCLPATKDIGAGVSVQHSIPALQEHGMFAPGCRAAARHNIFPNNGSIISDSIPAQL